MRTTYGNVLAGRVDELADEAGEEAAPLTGGLLVARVVVCVAAGFAFFFFLCCRVTVLFDADAEAAPVAGAPDSAAFELSGAGVVVTGLGGAADEPPEPDAAVPEVATPELDPNDARRCLE